jgi:hypothetical protein
VLDGTITIMSSPLIDAYIAALPIWQRDNLTLLRKAVHRLIPSVEEGWKWEVPVFLINGRLVCAMSAFAKHTKYNFFDGAALADPDHVFNGGLESKRSRSIDLTEDATVAADALDRLITAAFAAADIPSKKGR